MSIRERSPLSRTSITVVVVLLCAAWYAYSQGWFDWSRPGAEIESNNVSAGQISVVGQEYKANLG